MARVTIVTGQFDRDYSAAGNPNTITCGVDSQGGQSEACPPQDHSPIDGGHGASAPLPTLLFPPYSTPRPNLFDFGRPCARRPASARLPRQSASSLAVMLWSRPAPSFQARPALESKVVTSDSAALLYFCNRTPRPRAISGT